MRWITGLTVLALLMNAGTACAKEALSQKAARIAKARAKISDLKKNDPRPGQPAVNVEDLTIDEFLLLEAVPEGADVINADALFHAGKSYENMTTKQALLAIKMMRENGLEFSKDLEAEIKKNPEKASELMNETFSAMQGSNEISDEDAKKIRHKAMRRAEHFLGIKFKSLLDRQKQQMTTLK